MTRVPPPLIITCPDCQTAFDATSRPRGKSFPCGQCQKLLPVPFRITPPPRSLAHRAAGVIGICLVIGCVTLGTLSNAPGFAAASLHVRRAAAARPVRDLCWSEVLLHQRTGKWMAAGPLPKAIPVGEVPFQADPAFRALGFAPASTAFQFEVMIQGSNGVRCLGRYHDGVMAASASPDGVVLQP